LWYLIGQNIIFNSRLIKIKSHLVLLKQQKFKEMIAPKILITDKNELRAIQHLKIGFYPENLKEEMIKDVILKLEYCENLEVFEINLFCREFE